MLNSKRTDADFNIATPNYKPTDLAAFGWIGRETYPLVNACITYAELAAKISKVLGEEFTFASSPPSGMPPVDDMYSAQADHSGFYTATPVPNPGFVALGVKFATINEFLETEVKPRFGRKWGTNRRLRTLFNSKLGLLSSNICQV